jgi:hypothetical protein
MSASSESLQAITQSIALQYKIKTHKHAQLIDTYIILLLAYIALHTTYITLFGSFPFNSFLAATLTTITSFALAIALRLQLVYPKEFQDISPNTAFLHFSCCHVLLYFVALSFIG